MLGSVVYLFIVEYIWLYYVCLHQDTLYFNDKPFQDSTFDNISGIGMPEVLMNNMPCCGLSIE